MSPRLIAMPGNEAMTEGLARAKGWSYDTVAVHVFPDGECLPKLPADIFGRDVLLICTLDHPDAKLVPLLFTAQAARRQGARSVGLVAPYLCYMRQDIQFHPGEAITSRAFAGMVSQHFDRVVTIDPHLHRYRSLAEIYAIPATALHAGPAVADWIRENVMYPFLIGPDTESRQWVSRVAADCGADFTTLRKQRHGDTKVAESPLNLPDDVTPVLLDDIVSSGATILATLAQLPATARTKAVVVGIHSLMASRTVAAIQSNCARLVASNTVVTPFSEIDVTSILARHLEEEFA
jgi:ribose-phosphate pyrophosphokinase